jgi:hypothetical protein
VAERKSFLLRIDAAVLQAVQRWANDDLRSLNAQVEFVLRDTLRRVGRLPLASTDPQPQDPATPPQPAVGTDAVSRDGED